MNDWWIKIDVILLCFDVHGSSFQIIKTPLASKGEQCKSCFHSYIIHLECLITPENLK